MDDVSRLGPFFAADRHQDDALPAPWVPFRALLDGGFPVRVSATREALAGMASVPTERVPPRVAVSIAHMGLAARLVAPVLGSIALTGRAPALTVDDIHWQPVLGGPVPLSLAGDPVDAEAAVDALLTGPVRALTEIAEGVAPTVLWGNVASGVGGAAGQLTLHDLDGEPAAATFLAHPLLAGTWTGTPGFDFRRRSCCLIYQVGPAGPARYCGDCILRTRKPPP